MQQKGKFTEVGNPDYDAFTKMEGSMKKQMEQLGGSLMNMYMYCRTEYILQDRIFCELFLSVHNQGME